MNKKHYLLDQDFSTGQHFNGPYSVNIKVRKIKKNVKTYAKVQVKLTSSNLSKSYIELPINKKEKKINSKT